MNTTKINGVGLIRINNNIGIWYSSSMPPKNKVYVNLKDNTYTLDQLYNFYNQDQIELIKYSGEDDLIRKKLFDEILEDDDDIQATIINLFMLKSDCDVKDTCNMFKLNSKDEDENDIQDGEPEPQINDRLSNIEKRINKLCNKTDNIKEININASELFDNLKNCGFESV